MSFGSVNKIEMRKRALLEAIRFCGGITGLSRCIKASRTRVSNWCNRPEMEIPYQYVVLTEDITQVSIERLSPNTVAANKVIRCLRTNNKVSPFYVELSSIQIGNHYYPKYTAKERPIIVGTDGILISGLIELEIQKSSRQRKIQVTILDLEAIALGHRSIKEMNFDLLISEKIAIGLRLEQLIGNHRGKRNDLKRPIPSINENIEDKTSLRLPGDEVGRVDSFIANLIGLGSKATYHRAKQVSLHGDVKLIDAVDSKKISIKQAAKNLKQQVLSAK